MSNNADFSSYDALNLHFKDLKEKKQLFRYSFVYSLL